MSMNCKTCEKSFEVSEHEASLVEKLGISTPEMCIECRRKHRIAFWPYGKFHARTCDLTGENIISIFSKDARFPVYKREHWFSDKWEPPEMEYDPARSFFEQYKELQEKTPHPHSIIFGEVENSDYSDDIMNCKNCYLSRSILNGEDVYYSYRSFDVKDCVDVTFASNSENCYNCVYIEKSYNLKNCIDSRNCLDSSFLFDCRNVSNSFMCWNLRNKEYCFMNEQLSKEEYEKRLEGIQQGSYDEWKKLYEEYQEHIREDVVHRPDWNEQAEDSTGNYLEKCKSVDEGFQVFDVENAVDVFRGAFQKDDISISGIVNAELCYQSLFGSGAYKVRYSFFFTDCNESEYIEQCYNCDNCFGCVGLKKKKFCILNKQYSEEEYYKLRDQIIEKMKTDGEYGNLPPLDCAYTGHNTSLASFYYPYTKEQVKEMGGLWDEIETVSPDNATAEPPDNITDATDDVVKETLVCPETLRPFKYIPQEVAFYRKHNIPLPRTSPEHRDAQRYRYLAAVKPREISCFDCGNKTTTYYPEEWGYKKIACRECYSKHLV